MIYMIKAIYNIAILPPGCFIVFLLLFSLWIRKKSQGVSLFLGFFTCAFYLVCTPLIGNMLIHSLESRYNLPQNIAGDVIIVLGGGSTLDTPNFEGLGHPVGASANRLVTATILQKRLHLPILVSSGQVYRDLGNEASVSTLVLRGLQIPTNQILVEDKSLTTTENALFTKQILQAKAFKTPILVTSAFHMERSVLNFRNIGIEVIPVPTDYRTNHEVHFYLHQLFPSPGGLDNTYLALKEYLGILYLKINF